MEILKRILGICSTNLPQNDDCWSYSDGKIEVDLNKAPELSKAEGVLRLEQKGLRTRILILKGKNNEFHAIENICSHFGRRLDLVKGSEKVQCCSINKSTFSFTGEVMAGPAKESLKTFHVEQIDNKLIIEIKKNS